MRATAYTHPAVLLAFGMAGAPTPVWAEDPCSRSAETEAEGWVASAAGLEAWSRGELREARRCLVAARPGLPDSPVLARDLAQVEAQLGLRDAARATAREAARLGDVGGGIERALVAAAVAQTPEPEVLAGTQLELVIARTALGSREDALLLGQRLAFVPEELRPIARLSLAAGALRAGLPGAAADVAREAQVEAERQRDPYVANAARDLERRAAALAGTRVQLGFGLLAEHIVNPGFELDGGRGVAAGRARTRLALSTPIGSTVLRARVLADQRLLLSERDAFRSVERGGVAGGLTFTLPLSADLRSALLDLRLDALTVWGEAFEQPIATSIEGGPALRVSLGPRWWGELGLYGVWTNFPEAGRAQDRDRTGQRARLSVRHETRSWSVGGELGVLHDEAVAQLFDAVGIGLGVSGALALGPRLELRGRLSALARRWGPVGDEAVIGDASRRRELRVAGRAGAAWRFTDRFRLVASTRLVGIEIEGGRGLVHHAGSLGLEVGW